MRASSLLGTGHSTRDFAPPHVTTLPASTRDSRGKNGGQTLLTSRATTHQVDPISSDAGSGSGVQAWGSSFSRARKLKKPPVDQGFEKVEPTAMDLGGQVGLENPRPSVNAPVVVVQPVDNSRATDGKIHDAANTQQQRQGTRPPPITFNRPPAATAADGAVRPAAPGTGAAGRGIPRSAGARGPPLSLSSYAAAAGTTPTPPTSRGISPATPGAGPRSSSWTASPRATARAPTAPPPVSRARPQPSLPLGTVPSGANRAASHSGESPSSSGRSKPSSPVPAPAATAARATAAAAAAAATEATAAAAMPPPPAAATGAAAQAGIKAAAGSQEDLLPLELSFAQVMGRGSRNRAEGAEAAEDGVIDYTWQPNPELDLTEDQMAALQEEKAERAAREPDWAKRQAAAEAEAAVRAAYEEGGPPPAEYVGPVEVKSTKGRGFGLAASENVQAGQLLLVSSPVLLERGPVGQTPQFGPLLASALHLLRLADGIADGPTRPSAEELVDARTLASLYSGVPRSLADRPPADLAAWRGRQKGLLQGRPGGRAGARATRAGGVGTWSPERVMSLLQLNLLAEGTQDGAAAIARGEELSSVVGIWPEVSLANHSCAPNAVAVLIQDRMVVRATRSIPAGREVVLNWLGPDGPQGPLDQRREATSQMYRFVCRCARCELESQESTSVPFLYSDLMRTCGEPLATLSEALESRDLVGLTGAIVRIREALGKLSDDVSELSDQIDITRGRDSAAVMSMVEQQQKERALASRQAAGEVLGEEELAAAAAGRGGTAGLANSLLTSAALRMAGAGGESDPAAVAEAEAATVAMMKRKAGGPGAAKKWRKGGRALGGLEVAPPDKPTAQAWLVGSMLTVHDAHVQGLAMRAAWVGVDLGPGWHWPPPPPVVVPASEAPAAADSAAGPGDSSLAAQRLQPNNGSRSVTSETDAEPEAEAGAAGHDDLTGAAGDVVVMEDEELDELQVEAVAMLMGGLAAYVDVISQVLPGSRAHLLAASRLYALAESHLGPLDRVTSDLREAVMAAHKLRYGALSEETFERLMEAGLLANEVALRLEAEAEAGADGEASASARADGATAAHPVDPEQLFEQDARLRQRAAVALEAQARAAARAAAAATAPRSWPLSGAGAPGGAGQGAAVRERAQGVAGAKREAEGLELPEGVVAEVPSGGRRARSEVEEEAERELLRLLGQAPGEARGAGLRVRGSDSRDRAAAAAGGQGMATGASVPVGQKEKDEEEVLLRQLFTRDPDASGPIGNQKGDDDAADGQPLGTAASADGAAVRPGRRQQRQQPSSQQEQNPELDTLLDVFPGL